MPKGTQLDATGRERVRRRIYHEATALFRTRGVTGTSMRELAERCGVGTSTIYDYFPGKGDIVAEFFKAESIEVMKLAASLDGEEMSSRERVVRFLTGLGEFWGEDWPLVRAISRDAHNLGRHALARALEVREKVRDYLAGAVASMAEEGCRLCVTPGLGAALLLEMFRGLLGHAEGENVEVVAREALSLFLDGAKA